MSGARVDLARSPEARQQQLLDEIDVLVQSKVQAGGQFCVRGFGVGYHSIEIHVFVEVLRICLGHIRG